jgi:hypothetical protein
MTEDERAESVIRAGVPVPAKDWICPGCGEQLTIRETRPDGKPGRPAGVHGTFVLVDDDGGTGRPLDVWAHPKPRCVGGILKMLAGETPEDLEVPHAATPMGMLATTGRRVYRGASDPEAPQEQPQAAETA